MGTQLILGFGPTATISTPVSLPISAMLPCWDTVVWATALTSEDLTLASPALGTVSLQKSKHIRPRGVDSSDAHAESQFLIKTFQVRPCAHAE